MRFISIAGSVIHTKNKETRTPQCLFTRDDSHMKKGQIYHYTFDITIVSLRMNLVCKAPFDLTRISTFTNVLVI